MHQNVETNLSVTILRPNRHFTNIQTFAYETESIITQNYVEKLTWWMWKRGMWKRCQIDDPNFLYLFDEPQIMKYRVHEILRPNYFLRVTICNKIRTGSQKMFCDENSHLPGAINSKNTRSAAPRRSACPCPWQRSQRRLTVKHDSRDASGRLFRTAIALRVPTWAEKTVYKLNTTESTREPPGQCQVITSQNISAFECSHMIIFWTYMFNGKCQLPFWHGSKCKGWTCVINSKIHLPSFPCLKFAAESFWCASNWRLVFTVQYHHLYLSWVANWKRTKMEEMMPGLVLAGAELLSCWT